MRKTLLLFGVCTALLGFTSGASAQIGRFVGQWQNVNPGTGGITALDIAPGGTSVTVHAWGQCTPQDCDWGTMPGFAYGPNAGGNVAATAEAVTVLYNPGFAETLLVIRPQGMGLRVDSYTRFKDNSGRSNYVASAMFRRGARPPRPQPGPAPAEDCVSFNPGNTSVQLVNGNWTLVDGSHALFAFGSNQAAANRALAIVRRYRMDRSCFVGRPNASFRYLLVGNQSPAGPLPGEDCIAFNPANAQVQLVGGRWKVVEGGKLMYDFPNQTEAHQSLAIIRRYGFSQQCFVARPNPPFEYLRR